MRLIGLVVFCAVFLMSVPYVFAGSGSENCEKARSSADVMACLSRQYESAQKDLNRAFDRLGLERSVEDLAEIKNLQARWLEYRDMACQQETGHLETESLQRLESLRCMNRLTQERIIAINNTLKNKSESEDLGEAAAQPRWMNALASDHPDIFWRYGDRISGDIDCDEEAEYMMSGLRLDVKMGVVHPVLSISENPQTGRPVSDVINVPVRPKEVEAIGGDAEKELAETSKDETDAVQACGSILNLRFEEGSEAVAPVDIPEAEGGALTSEVSVMCKNSLLVASANCPDRKIHWNGKAYAFGE